MSSKGIIVSVILAVLAGGLFAHNQLRPSCQISSGFAGTNIAQQPQFVATIAPLAAILRELSDGRAVVHTLLKPGSSPHTYEPRPSDLKQVMNARGFFYVDERLDGWASKLQSAERIRVMDLVPKECRLQLSQECCPREHAKPGHVHKEAIIDPHFWLDPCVVRDSLPGLVAELCRLDPSGSEVYESNAAGFRDRLNEMDSEIHAMIDPLRGSKVATAHASFGYLCNQYGLQVAMVVSDSPGKEPSPKQIQKLAEQAKAEGVKAIYSEPQIPKSAAEMLSEASGVPLYELDPVGGCSERCEYHELILYNAQVLVASLK